MKRYFLLVAATLAVMVSCSKKEMQQSGGQVIDDNSPVQVQFNLDAPSLMVTKTKGMGSVDAWKEQPLYILGFSNDLENYSEGNALIPNVKAVAPEEGMEGGLTVTKEVNGQQEPYFYSSSAVYSFFGYYEDGAANSREADGAPTLNYGTSVSLDLTIDGTQDVMAAKADPLRDAAKAPQGNVKVSQTYSAYAARRGVHPTLKFEHLLTRFNFYIVAGSESGEATEVTDITIDSKTEATLNLVPNVELISKGTKTPLILMARMTEGAELQSLEPQLPYVNKDDKGAYVYDYETVKETPSAKIGESVMVIPGETEHEIVISTDYTLSEQQELPTTVKLKASDITTKDGSEVTKFEAGCQYDVILTIYGPEEVKITAVLTEWEEGGHATIDPDEDGPFAVSAAFAVAADETSYKQLPEAYLEQFPWEENEENLLNGPDALPWIAIEFTPEQAIEVVATETATGYEKKLSFPVENTKIGLLTLCAKELGVEKLEGEWIVTVNDIPTIITFE